VGNCAAAWRMRTKIVVEMMQRWQRFALYHCPSCCALCCVSANRWRTISGRYREQI